jgi:transposase
MRKHSSKKGTRKAAEPQWSVGLDLGDRSSRYAIVDEDGELIAEGECRNTPRGLAKVFGEMPGSRVALESGSQSGWIARELTKLGHEALVRARTLLVNAARGLSKAHGERLVKTSTQSFASRAAAELTGPLTTVLEPLLAQIRVLSEQIAAADRGARQAAEGNPAAARLMTVPGVGPLTALTFVHTLEDPGRFRRSREVGAYLGLVPRQAQSGSRDPQLPISKAGDERLRRLLVQCAHRILGPFGAASSLRSWAQTLAARGGPAGRKRAIVALARKLAVVLHRLWARQESWRPFPLEA